MKTKKLNTKFHQNIAKIFYAIAKIDKVVERQEIEALKKVVKEEWLLIDETLDAFGTDTAYQIEIVFDWLYSKNATAEDCVEDFIEYYHNHLFFFSDEIKQLIIYTGTKITDAFASKNKSELILLDKLRIELSQQFSKYNNI